MFNKKPAKTVSSILSKFTQDLDEVVQAQQAEYDKQTAIIDEATEKRASAQAEKADANKAIENIKKLFGK